MQNQDAEHRPYLPVDKFADEPGSSRPPAVLPVARQPPTLDPEAFAALCADVAKMRKDIHSLMRTVDFIIVLAVIGWILKVLATAASSVRLP